MTTIESTTTIIQEPETPFEFDEAQLAAVSFLARYSGRTLEAYRHDLRGYFQWAADGGVEVLRARPHIELFRAWMEDRGLAASTIDRRLSTVCGFYRFAHIDGRIGSNPAQYVRRPQVHTSDARGLDRSELGVFLFTAEQYDHEHAALAVLLGLNGLRVSEACGTNVEDLGFERGHRTLRIVGKGNKPATISLVPRTARTIDLAVGERHEGPILRRRDGQRLDRRTAHRWVRSIGKRGGLGSVHPHMLRAAFIMAALDAGVPLRDVQIAARHAARAGATFGELCETWLAHARVQLAANTVAETRRHLDRHLLPTLGDVPLAALRPEHLDGLYRDLLDHGRNGKPLSGSTVRRIHGIAHRALTIGVRWGWLTTNPATGTMPPRPIRRPITPPSPQDVAALIAAARNTDPALPRS